MPVYFSEVKKILRESQAQFWVKLRKLRLGQTDGFLIKSRAFRIYFCETTFTVLKWWCRRGAQGGSAAPLAVTNLKDFWYILVLL